METAALISNTRDADNDAQRIFQDEPDMNESIKAMLTTHLYFNITIAVFLPLGVLSEVLNWGDSPTFLLNMVAIIGLAKLLDLATDQLSKKLGQTLGALLNASFGNAVELIVTIMALREGLTTVVQSSLLGSVLSNLLLVMGACFYIGGLKYSTQTFSLKAANINASLLGVTMIAFLLPAAIRTKNSSGDELKIIDFSRGISVLILIIYAAFLIFQLKTHTHYFTDAEDSEEEDTIVNVPVAIGALVTATILIGISSEFLVGSIEGISKSWDISETFIGLILIPIVGNAAEHVSAVGAAMRNKMDLAIGVALGSSLQIALFVTPVAVCIAWMMNVPLTLEFPLFDIAVVFLAILTVNNLILDGESNWLEGFMLLIIYFIVGFAYWIY